MSRKLAVPDAAEHLPPWFSVRKAAQVVAYFAHRNQKSISVIKAMKLAYLSNRESMMRRSMPVFHDDALALPKGPVPEFTYGIIRGEYGELPDWSRFLVSESGNGLREVNVQEVGDLDEFSPSDLSVLEYVWDRYGALSESDLVNRTHDECSEWKSPRKPSSGEDSPRRIPVEDIFRALGYEHNVAELAEDVQADRDLDAALFPLLAPFDGDSNDA